jgi:hypothetical protein
LWLAVLEGQAVEAVLAVFVLAQAWLLSPALRML